MKRLPLLAIVLGVGGLVPFLFFAFCSLAFGAFGPVPHLGMALLGYGACILSFLGAVHWGLALEQPAILVPGAGRLDMRRFLLGVCPALVAWIALYIGAVHDLRTGLLLEAAGFVGVYAVEKAGDRQGALPPGYLKLRLFLTVVVVACLLAGMMAHLGDATVSI